TGPLGQGFANGVGMAIAERRLAAEFNRPDHAIVDHRVYGICSDGDLQEGIASEAASLAGHLRLGKIVYLYDDNHVQLDGPTSMAFSEDVLERFDAYGWHTQRVEDGNDVEAITRAVEAARADGRPSLVAVRTHIGYGSPNQQDTQKAHGQALGEDEVRLVKQNYGWDPDAHFVEPAEAVAHFRQAVPRGEELAAEWDERLEAYAAAYPGEAAELRRRLAGRLADGWDADLRTYAVGEDLATRQASQAAIAGLAEDGPTHQPIEHYAALRAMPNLWFVRPGDANETAAAWRLAVRRRGGPVALSLTRQKLPTLPETAERAPDGVARGGYVVREASGGAGAIDLILLATGSELGLAAGAAERLE